MCRLFGFRSNMPARVHEALVHEANSLRVQSHEHKDGWGIASYEGGGLPEVARGVGPAHADPEFERISNLLSSHAVIAHVRLASVGPVTLDNAHPFTFGAWTFAHNGTLQRFGEHRQQVEALIDPDLRLLFRGDTDSERCFYLFLTFLRQNGGLEEPNVEQVAKSLAITARTVVGITEAGATKPSSTNFLVTDGRLLLATRRHRTLFFTERRHAGDLPHPEPKSGDTLEQIVIASEKLDCEEHWHEVPEDSVIAVDDALRFHQWTFEALVHPV